MNLTVGLSEQNAAVLEAKARAARMKAEDYLSNKMGQAGGGVASHSRYREIDLEELKFTARGQDGV